MNFSLSSFGPENFLPRDGFDSPVPGQPRNIQAESGAC